MRLHPSPALSTPRRSAAALLAAGLLLLALSAPAFAAGGPPSGNQGDGAESFPPPTFMVSGITTSLVGRKS